MAVTGNQIRAARSLVNLDQIKLAERAGVSANTVRNLEAYGSQPVGGRVDTLNAIVEALQQEGVALLEDGQQSADGLGVRLKRK